MREVIPRARTRDPVECPHCGEATVPNERADGSVVCSCAAARDLPPRDGPKPARPGRAP
jgi:hypothetical protein